MNKALDYNKLLQDQTQGKRLKTIPQDHYYASFKLDGHYTEVVVETGSARYYTSSGKQYWPEGKTWLDSVLLKSGVYICERIVGNGMLGDRTKCSLTGPRSKPVAPKHHRYIAHDYIPLDHYRVGKSTLPYSERRLLLENNLHYEGTVFESTKALTMEEIEAFKLEVLLQGYEGVMLKSPDWLWEETQSRKVTLMKYKSRPTADLLCIDTTDGEGKYKGKIGALVLQDSKGRIVTVGSGLADRERDAKPAYFIEEIIEIEYEQIIDTYIQPTYIGVRHDKTESD